MFGLYDSSALAMSSGMDVGSVLIFLATEKRCKQSLYLSSLSVVAWRCSSHIVSSTIAPAGQSLCLKSVTNIVLLV